MYDDPYLGIINPMPLFDSLKVFVDNDKYISIQLYRKNTIDYYEVIFHNSDNEIFFGKFYKDNNLIGSRYKDGKILVYTEEFNSNFHKMMIVQVLALYDINDDTFYYCSEEDALLLFDNTIDSSGLKNKDKKILRTNVRKRIFNDEESVINNFYTVRRRDVESTDDLSKPKIIKFPKLRG